MHANNYIRLVALSQQNCQEYTLIYNVRKRDNFYPHDVVLAVVVSQAGMV